MSLEQLEAELHMRDRRVRALRAEMAILTPHWERAWERKKAARRGPKHLEQGVSIGK